MRLYHKEGWLYYVQTDHLSGEECGCAIDALYEAGACNVQVISTITKKNRSGLVFMIDVRPERREAVEQAVVLELRVSGWHVIRTEHHHLEVEYIRRPVVMLCGQQQFELLMEVKKCYGAELILRPENRCVSAMKRKLMDYGIKISMDTCSRILREMEEKQLNEWRIK